MKTPEPGVLLNTRAKSDIGIYSSEDFPKEAECIRARSPLCQCHSSYVAFPKHTHFPLSTKPTVDSLTEAEAAPSFNHPETDRLSKFFWRLSHAPKHIRSIDATFTCIQSNRKLARYWNATTKAKIHWVHSLLFPFRSLHSYRQN